MAPLFDVAGTEADAPPSIGGDAPPDKGLLVAPGKVSAEDGAPGEGAAGVSKSLLVRSQISSTNYLHLRIGRHATALLVPSGNVGGEVQNTGVVPYIPW